MIANSERSIILDRIEAMIFKQIDVMNGPYYINSIMMYMSIDHLDWGLDQGLLTKRLSPVERYS